VPKWFKYHKLLVCSSCLKKYIIDYAAILFEGSDGQCDLCGAINSPAFFSATLARSKRKKLEG